VLPEYYEDWSPKEQSTSIGDAIGWGTWTAASVWFLSKTSFGSAAFGAAAEALGSVRGFKSAIGSARRTLSPKKLVESAHGFFTRPHSLRQDIEEVVLVFQLAATGGDFNGGLSYESRVDALKGALRGFEGPADTLRLRDVLADKKLAKGSSKALIKEIARIRRAGKILQAAVTQPDFESLLDLPFKGIRITGGFLRDTRWREAGEIPFLLEKFAIKAPTLPVLGEVEWLTHPLKWAADLIYPVDIWRDQRHFQAFRGPNLGKKGGTRFLKRSVHGADVNVVEKMWILAAGMLPRGKPYSGDFDWVPLSLGAMPRPIPGFVFRGGTKALETPVTNVNLVAADSSIGKGVRIRLHDYEHSLDNYMMFANINPRSIKGKALAVLNDLGIGPHLVAPKIVEGRRVEKPGAIKSVYQTIRNWAFPRPPTTPPVGIRKKVWNWIFPSVPKTPLTPTQIDKIEEGQLIRDIRPFVWSSPAGILKRKPKGGQYLSDFFNYLTMRPMALVEELTGLGIKAGETPLGSMASIFGRVALPAYALYQAGRYLNYKTKQTLGYSPSDLVTDTYVGAQIGLSSLKTLTGIRRGSERAEEFFPGIIDSPISAGARTVLGAALGAKAGRLFGSNIFGRIGAVAVAALGAIALGSDPREGPGELSRIYSGEQPVPIRRGAYWELGRASWFGGDIEYYRPHAIALSKSGFQEKSIYGSEENYWKYGTFSPESFFGIRMLLNTDYAQKRNLYTRPYPVYGGFGSSFPIVGPLIEAASSLVFGEKEHPLLQQAMYQPVAPTGGETGFQFQPGMAAAGGYTGPGGAISPYRVDQSFGRQISNIQDWFGMPGFLFGAIKDSLLGGGMDFFQDSRQLERGSRLTSPERWFYDTLNMGGGLTTTEVMRRFIPRTSSSTEQVNPIPNQMEDWLPGSRSAFEKDRSFTVDFHTGDPFTKIKVGEARLPGKGYEAVRPLHSGIPGIYDAIDRLIILSDIAPYSEAYQHYKTIVDMMFSAGAVDVSWGKRIAEAKNRIQEKEQSKLLGTPNLVKAPPTETLQLTPTKILDTGAFFVKEQPGKTFRLAGFDDKRDSAAYRMVAAHNASSVEEAMANIDQARSTIKGKLESLVGKTIPMVLSTDQATRFTGGQVNTFVPGVSESLYRSDAWDPKEVGLAALMRGNAATRAAGGFWYDVMSKTPPFPLGYLKNKLMPVRSAIDDYQEFQVKSQKVAVWEHPIEGYVKPWLRGWADWLTPGDYVPGEFREKQEIDRRFGALKYLKAKMGADAALAAGDKENALSFKNMMKRTPAGISRGDPKTIDMYGRAALSEWERPYFESMKGIQTSEERARALGIVSPTLGFMLSSYWKQQMPKYMGFENKDLQSYELTHSPQAFQRYALQDVVGAKNLPGKDWSGFDARINMNAVKIKYLENEGLNIHNFGLWESQRDQYHRQFPDIEIPQIMEFGPSKVGLLDTIVSRAGLDSQSLVAMGYGGNSASNVVYRQSYVNQRLEAKRRQDYRLVSSLYGIGN